jgi:hypothetical protein
MRAKAQPLPEEQVCDGSGDCARSELEIDAPQIRVRPRVVRKLLQAESSVFRSGH